MPTERIWENKSDESGSGEKARGQKRAKQSQGQTGSVGVGVKDHLGVLAIGSLSFWAQSFQKPQTEHKSPESHYSSAASISETCWPRFASLAVLFLREPLCLWVTPLVQSSVRFPVLVVCSRAEEIRCMSEMGFLIFNVLCYKPQKLYNTHANWSKKRKLHCIALKH